MTKPRWDSAKRAATIAEDDRGPDSVECSPTSHYLHILCLLDYSDLGSTAGFTCGCRCHDIECDECGAGNGMHHALCAHSAVPVHVAPESTPDQAGTTGTKNHNEQEQR